MRRVILLAAVGLFMTTGLAYAEGGCGFGGINSASSGAPDQSVASEGTVSKPAVTKETKG